MSLLRSYLEANSVLSPAQLEVATRHQQAQGGSLDTALLELGLLGAGDLDLHLGRACGLPTVPSRLLETGPTRPWGHVPKALLDIGWAMPLALEDGNVLVAVHPDLPDARLGQLYRQIRGFMPMVAPECCLAKLAAERSNGIVAPRFAMLVLDVLDALQAREAQAGAPPDPAPADVSVPEDMSPARDDAAASRAPGPGSASATKSGTSPVTSAAGLAPHESGTFAAASSGTFAAASSGTFTAASSGTFPDLRSVGAHAPGTRHGPAEPTPRATPAATPPVSQASPATPPVSQASPATPPVSQASPAAPPVSQASPATPPVSQASPAAPPVAQASPATPPVSQASPAAPPVAQTITAASGARSAPAPHEPGRADDLAQRLAPARAALVEARERDRITAALVQAAAQIAPRVALFGVRREGLRVLAVPGALPLPSSLVIPIPEGSLLDRAVLGLIRLKLLAEPTLAAAIGRPLGIPCLFEPVFAQERGVLMLYVDRDGGLFDAADHAAVRDLCDLASTNLEALLRTRGFASSRPAANPGTSGVTPVPTDSPASAAATPGAAPPPASHGAVDLPAHGEDPAEPAGSTDSSHPRAETDTPQHRPGRAARAAKRQVISLINPIRRDNSGGHSAPPTARAEPHGHEVTPDPQASSGPLVSPVLTDSPRATDTPVLPDSPRAVPVPADSPWMTDPPVPTDSPSAAPPVPADSPSAATPVPTDSPEMTAPPVPTDSPSAATPVPADSPSAAPPVPADSPEMTATPVPTDRPARSRRQSSDLLPQAAMPGRHSSATSSMVSGMIVDPEDAVPAPLASRAITRAEPEAPVQPVPAEPEAPVQPVPAEPEAPVQPVPAEPEAPVQRVAEAQGPADPARGSVPEDSLAAPSPVPSGLHLPNLVLPPGTRRGLGKKGDRARPAEPGIVIPDLRRRAEPSAATPILSIPTSLIAPTPLPGAQRRGSRTGQYPVPPGADAVTLNMPRLVRDDVASRGPASAAKLSPGTAAAASEASPLAGVMIPADLTRKPALPAAPVGVPTAPINPPAPSAEAVTPATAEAATLATAEATTLATAATTLATAAATATATPEAATLEAGMDPTGTELSAETSATAAVVEAIADAMSATAQAADLEDDLSSETAPTRAGQGSGAAAPVDADAVLEAYLSAPDDPEARGALVRLGPAGLERIAARFPGPIDLGDQTDARSFPPPSAHGPLLRACVEIGPAITPYILELLEYPRPQLRFYAAFVFQELRDPRCLRALAQHAFDPDAEVRLIATRVLESYSRVEGFIAATELVRAELRSRDRERALLAAEAAGTLRDTQAVHTLIELLSVRDKQVRETALEALCSITAKHLGYRPAKWRVWYDEHGQETRVEWVIEALRHRDAAVRRWAADELVRITGHRVTAPAGEKLTAKYLLQAWQQWWAASAADRG